MEDRKERQAEAVRYSYTADLIGKFDGVMAAVANAELRGFYPDRDKPGIWATLHDGGAYAYVAEFAPEDTCAECEDWMYESGFWKVTSVTRVTEWRSEEKLW